MNNVTIYCAGGVKIEGKYLIDRPDPSTLTQQRYIYDLQANDKGEIKYLCKAAYWRRSGSVETKKPLHLEKKVSVVEIIFWDQVPEEVEEE